MTDLGAGGWTHFVGIGGVGMSGLALLLMAEGYRVTGSDLKSNQFTRKLEARGAIIYHHHDAANIAPGVREVVVSSAVSSANPEIAAARQLGIPVIKRGELLARLFNNKRGIAIAGAHGKTTSSAMIALAMIAGGLEPTAVIGGYVQELASNAVYGQGPFFVAEADESDASFLWLQPEIALVTNIEDDHLDHYGSLDDIIAAFDAFINNVRPGGKAVLCTEDARTELLSVKSACEVITYGFAANSDYRATDLKLEGLGGQAAIYYCGSYLGTLNLKAPGKHNILNALGAVAVCHQLGVAFADIASALADFRGVGRRFEVLWSNNNIWVVDDYAHHPTEIKAALQAAGRMGAKRIIAVFQPHRYSRTQQLYRELGLAFTQADIVIVNDIYSAGEKPIPGVTSQLIVEQVRQNSQCQVYYLPTLEEITAFLQDLCLPGDLLITLGAGDVWKVAKSLAQEFKSRQELAEMGA
ncbi:MAG: UDP-N-acetylmuramate--L-alanine ligase [Clostridia bacterium]|nr:UDP-N-acetylmuramate--L-alanine ligase [Clostridia bacterium]